MEWKTYKSFLINRVANGKTKRNRSAMKSKGKIYGRRTNNQNHKNVIIFLFTKNSKEPKHLQPSPLHCARTAANQSWRHTHSQKKLLDAQRWEIWKREKKIKFSTWNMRNDFVYSVQVNKRIVRLGVLYARSPALVKAWMHHTHRVVVPEWILF